MNYSFFAILFCLIFDTSQAYRSLRMTNNKSSEHIANTQKQVKNTKDVLKVLNRQIDNAIWAPHKSIEIDTIFMNVYQIDHVSFKQDSDIVAFKLNKLMDNIYYVEQNRIYKISNETKIVSKALRNILVYEMDIDQKVNVVLFNSQGKK